MIALLVCAVLTGLGVVYAVKRGRQRGMRSMLRILGWALIPLGLKLSGLLTMFDRIGSAMARWAASLVFNPFVWLGIAMLGLSALLILTTAVGRGEGAGEGRAAPAPTPRRELDRSGRSPAAGPSSTAGFEDVEEILRRHGVK